MSIAKSVVISCAGIGSRLGLGTTKALINIYGKSLIGHQLEQLKDVEDVRIVVGFQAKEVIEEACKYRKDLIFVYNHDYFETKTGASFYLGAKDGNEYAMEVDGDLLIHPEDMEKLLHLDGEWLAYADKMSDDAVMVTVDDSDYVNAFSTRNGNYEWTGPCCIKKERLHYSAGSVFEQLEPYLPMKGVKIRACDIDTFNDYQRALDFVKDW